MKCIDELQKIGIDKVSAKTRITQDKLQNIIDFKYDAFDKTRARGFVQIIQREFGIDLSEWFAAYNDYHSAPTEQTEEASEGADEIARQINIPIESDKKDKSYVVLIVLLIVLVVLFMSFFIYNNFISPSTSAKSTSQNTLTPLQEIQQNKNDLAREEAQNVADLSADSANPSENSVDSSANQNAQDSKADSNTENLANLSANTTNPSANPNPPITPSVAQTTIATQTEELVITPNEPLWVGIIDLKSRRKKQLNIDARHSITLDGDKIIRTGHSYFSVSSGTNFAKQYIGGDNKYFLYKMDGGLSEISKAEFLELNKGEEW